MFADIPVIASSIGQAIITASLNGASVTATVVITPPELVTLTLAPVSPSAYVAT